jgi:hypothetical protein
MIQKNKIMVIKKKEIENAKALIKKLEEIYCLGLCTFVSFYFNTRLEIFLPNFYKFHHDRIKKNKKSITDFWWKPGNKTIRIKRLKQFYNLNDATFKK